MSVHLRARFPQSSARALPRLALLQAWVVAPLVLLYGMLPAVLLLGPSALIALGLTLVPIALSATRLARHLPGSGTWTVWGASRLGALVDAERTSGGER